MLDVVPGEEPLAERLGVLVGSEPVREIGLVLERLELRLGVNPGVGNFQFPQVGKFGFALTRRVVIEDLGPGLRGHHPQGDQERGHRLGGRGRSA